MPNPPSANMSLVLPTEDGDSDQWDFYLNAALALVDAHDHTSGKGVKVPSAGLKINADVSWAFSGTNYSITDMKALDFAPVSAGTITGYGSALFVNSDDSNNLYFRNQSGTNVKITDGSTLNFSVTGGIGGDYSSIGALLDYDDATDTYRFRQQTSASVRQYAKIASADLKLFEYIAAGGAVVPTNSVTLKSPAALAGSYTMTALTALPASTSVLQISSAGAWSASNLLPALDDTTLQSNKNLILQGTGTIKHSTHKLQVNTSTPIATAGSVSAGTASDGSFCRWILAVGTTAYISIDGLRYNNASVQDRITAVRVYHTGPLTNADNLTLSLSRVVSTTGAKTDEGSAASTTSPLNLTSLTRDTSGLMMYIKLVTTANSDYGIRYIEVDYERP